MSIRIMTQVWANSTMKGGSLLVLLAIADFADDDGVAWPSMAVLAKKSRLTRRQAQTVVAKLEEKGELQVERGGDGPGDSSLYRVLVKGEKTSPLRRPKRAKFFTKRCEVFDDPSIRGTVIESPVVSGADSAPATAYPDGAVRAAEPPAEAAAKPLTAQQAMIKALADVTGLDDHLSGPRLARLASGLNKSGYTPAQVSQVYGAEGVYWRADWRGLKGQPPTDNVIRDTIKHLLRGNFPVSGGQSNGAKTDSRVHLDSSTRAPYDREHKKLKMAW